MSRKPQTTPPAPLDAVLLDQAAPRCGRCADLPMQLDQHFGHCIRFRCSSCGAKALTSAAGIMPPVHPHSQSAPIA